MTRLDYSTMPIFVWALIHGKPLHAGEWVLVFMGCLFCMGACYTESTVYPGTHGDLLRTVIRFTQQLLLLPGWSYQYFIILVVLVVCLSLPVCGPVGRCILSTAMMLPDFEPVILPPTIHVYIAKMSIYTDIRTDTPSR